MLSFISSVVALGFHPGITPGVASPSSPAVALGPPRGLCFPAGGNLTLCLLRQLFGSVCWWLLIWPAGTPTRGHPGGHEGLQGTFLGRLFWELFFFNLLLSWPEFCSATSSCVSFCEPQSLSPQHGWIGEPLTCSVVWSVSPSGKLELLRASLHLFFFFLFGFAVLPVVQSLKMIVSYILSGFLVGCCGRVSVVCAISSCQKEKSHLTFDSWSLLWGYMVFITVI